MATPRSTNTAGIKAQANSNKVPGSRDCNAGMIMPILAIQKGMCIIPERLIHPAFSVLTTYLRKYKRMTLDELVDDTFNSIKKAKREEKQK
jgi:hypothetical protein